MRGKWMRYVGRGLGGGLAVAIVAGLGLMLLLTRPREQVPVAGPQTPPAEPSAAVIANYLSQIRTATAAYYAQRYADATRAFEAAMALRPAEPQPYRYLAELYWREGRQEQALQSVRSLTAVMPDAYFLDQVGRILEESGLRALAMHFYRQATHLAPGFPGARYNLGRAYLQASDLEGGIAEMQETLRLHPDFPEAHQALGMAFTELGRVEHAIAHLQRALELKPDLTEARNHLGRIYLAQGSMDEAIRTFRSLVERAPDVAEARHNLAVAYARAGLWEPAVEQFREALRLRPDFREARLDLATLLLEMRRSQDAIDALQAILSATSQDRGQSDQLELVEVRYRLGVAHWMAGQAAAAIQELEAVLRAQPAHAGVHANLGRLYYQTHQFDRAWRHARRAESLGVPMAELIAALRRVSVEPR